MLQFVEKFGLPPCFLDIKPVNYIKYKIMEETFEEKMAIYKRQFSADEKYKDVNDTQMFLSYCALRLAQENNIILQKILSNQKK